MVPISVVIICKNGKIQLQRTLPTLQGLTDDVLVYDNGSTDDSVLVAREMGARVVEGPWLGFGPTKNKANQLARYDWILSLDTDEAIDRELFQALTELKPERGVAYDLVRKNFVGDKQLKYGDWGTDHHVRLFHRGDVQWNQDEVHEEPTLPTGYEVRKLKGALLHRTTESTSDYRQKLADYARMSARKYLAQGKKANWVKLFLSPVFTFIRGYILKLGFLDGITGLEIASITAWYTRNKYLELEKIRQASKK